jgi:hypothetical protein
MLPLGGLQCVACSEKWNFDTNSAFPGGKPSKTTENFDRFGRLQDLPDANWLLVSSIKYANPNVSPYLAVALFEKSLHVCFTDLSFHVHTLDEHQTVVYNICEENTCLYAHTCIQIYTYLYFWLFECCRGNGFTEPLPSNDRGIHIQTYRMMGWIYEVLRSDGLKCHDVHTKFYKECFSHS